MEEEGKEYIERGEGEREKRREGEKERGREGEGKRLKEVIKYMYKCGNGGKARPIESIAYPTAVGSPLDPWAREWNVRHSTFFGNTEDACC